MTVIPFPARNTEPLSLFDPDDYTPTTTHGLTIDDAFHAFHAANPWVYAALVKLTRDLTHRGHNRVGMKMLFEVLRWQWAVTTNDPTSTFKLNNNYTSRYARLIMDTEPDLTDVYETRTLHT